MFHQSHWLRSWASATSGYCGKPAVQQSVPEFVGILGRLERWVGMVLHAVVVLVIVGVEAGIIMQSLAINGKPFASSLRHGAHTLGGADVDEIHWAALFLGKPYSAPEGNVLR